MGNNQGKINQNKDNDELTNELDLIGTEYIVKSDLNSLVNLTNSSKCESMLILTSDILNSLFTKKQLTYLLDKKEIKEDIFYIDINKYNNELYSEKGLKTKKGIMCNNLASYYITIAKIYAAIETTKRKSKHDTLQSNTNVEGDKKNIHDKRNQDHERNQYNDKDRNNERNKGHDKDRNNERNQSHDKDRNNERNIKNDRYTRASSMGGDNTSNESLCDKRFNLIYKNINVSDNQIIITYPFQCELTGVKLSDELGIKELSSLYDIDIVNNNNIEDNNNSEKDESITNAYHKKKHIKNLK